MGAEVVGWGELLPYALPAVVAGALALRLWQAGFREGAAPTREPLTACERGTSVVEFTLVFPIMIQLLLLLVQFALLCNARLVIGQAAFNAARSAVVWLPAELDDRGHSVTNQERQVRIRRAAVMAVMPVAKRAELGTIASLQMESLRRSLLSAEPPNWTDGRRSLNGLQEAAVVGIYVFSRSGGDEYESPRVPVATRSGDDQLLARWKRYELAFRRYLFADWRTEVSVDGVLLPSGDREVLTQRTDREPVTVKVRHRLELTVPWARVLLAGSEWRSQYGFWSNVFGGFFRDAWVSLVPPYRYLEDEVTLINEGWVRGHGCR